MGLTVDTSQTFLSVVNTEPVTFFSKTAEGTFNSVPLANAKRRMLTKEQKGGDASLASYGIAWTVWAAQLGTVVPKFGDKLTDAGGVAYQVKSVEVCSFGSRFRLICLRQPG